MNPIVTILNLRTFEKQHGNVQHQSAAGNRALIAAYVVHENYLGNMPCTSDIVKAMNKSQPMISKYLNQLSNESIIRRVWGFNIGRDKRATYWIARGWKTPA
jgi:hypothetical protein